MATFVLVPGAWHGAWCWETIKPILVDAGHAVVAKDLAGLGLDQTPAKDISLDRWVDSVVDSIDAADENVVLVGHSRGGAVIQQVAETRPERINKLVFLTAMLIKNGEAALPRLGALGPSPLQEFLSVDEQNAELKVAHAGLKQCFYNGCSAEVAARASAMVRPEPLIPCVTPLSLTEGRYGSVERHYISCQYDNAITPSAQEVMYTESPCVTVTSLPTDHSPFLSAPEELCGILHMLSS